MVKASPTELALKNIQEKQINTKVNIALNAFDNILIGLLWITTSLNRSVNGLSTIANTKYAPFSPPHIT